MITKRILRFRRASLVLILLTILLGCVPVVRAELEVSKIATVNMQSLFKEYHRTTEVQREINVERARIQKEDNERRTRIKKLEEDLQALRKQLEDPVLTDKKKQELFQDFQEKRQEGVSLDRERRERLQRMMTALNEEMVRRMLAIFDDIRKIVVDTAKADDFDYVFDRSGMSTSQVPFLLYAKDATDITPELLKVINEDAPKDLDEGPAK